MTATTTDKSRRGRIRRVGPWTISLILHGLLLLALLAFDPLGITEIKFSRADERERTEQVAERERQRQALEQERRQRLQLTQEHAERLKREAERRHRDELTQRLERLIVNRQRVDELRQQRLAEIHERTAEDVQSVVAAQLVAQAETLQRMMEPLTREGAVVDPADASIVHQRAEQVDAIRELAEHLRDSPLDSEKARELINHARDVRGTMLSMANAGQFVDYHAARGVEHRAFQMMQTAGRLTNEPDMAGLNDTSTARGPDALPEAVQQPPQSLSAADAYDAAREVEKQIDQANTELRAASLAMAQRTSFAEAMSKITQPQVNRPDLGTELRGTPTTIGGLNEVRETLEQARGVMQEMALRSEQTVRSAEGIVKRGGDQQAMRVEEARLGQMLRMARHGEVIDLTGVMGGYGSDDLLRDADRGDDESDMQQSDNNRIVLEDRTIFAHALPGQRFSAAADRQGWLYLNTWYIVGPWRVPDMQYEPVHEPETAVDLDAIYYNGYVDGDGPLDGELRWQFVQTEEMRVQPPNVRSGAVWYAYTEVYFEQDKEMLLAIASDDAAKVWINDMVVWHDTGLSPWSMGEGFRRVRFQQGYNRVLVRVTNGPAHCIFSVLICPPESVEQSASRE